MNYFKGGGTVLVIFGKCFKGGIGLMNCFKGDINIASNFNFVFDNLSIYNVFPALLDDF